MVDREPINVREIQMAEKRKRFFFKAVTFFILCMVLAFWVLPRFTALAVDLGAQTGKPLPTTVHVLLSLAHWFKVIWIFIGIALGALCVMVGRGYFDTLLPLLDLVLLLLGVGGVVLAFYAFYSPIITLTG